MMTKTRGPEGPTKDDIAWYLKVIAGQKKEIQRLQELKGGSELKTLKKENLRLRQKLDLMPTNVDLGCGTPKPLYELYLMCSGAWDALKSTPEAGRDSND